MSGPLDQASANQRKASDPRSSAWVSANAGSGKTHVLAQRVIRLLLAGARPSRILCLTFTKAAAAHMADKVFDALAKWPRLDDAELTRAIVATGAPTPDATELVDARKLFARVLETPGGLKIQTIHAFCERVLHLFPFEGNAPAGFRPLDEREAAMARADAHARVFASADDELRSAIDRIAEFAGPDGFPPLLAETARLSETLAASGEDFPVKLAERLGLAPGEDERAVVAEMLHGGGGPTVWRTWARALNAGSTNDKKLAETLTKAATNADPEAALDGYLSAFLTKTDMTPRKTLATKATTEKFPDIVDALYAERDRLYALLDKRRAAAAVARTRDLHLVSRACERAYARAKAARGALDFDDLIAKTDALFQRADAAWILYKLDRGVEHILVDEAQDTSGRQWRILEKLAEDFLSGDGVPTQGRTLFAVGDEKQSIFSFQGAEPHLFDAKRREFAKRHGDAQRPFVDLRLIHSFRSAPSLLDAVDKVFGVPEVWRGVSASDPVAPQHEAIRDRLPGVVEVWPTLIAETAPAPSEWRLPLDAERLTHPAVALADRIAAVVARWTSPGSPERVIDPATGEPRPIRPGDVLILVRSRGPFFNAMTRALRRARVPAAGADRLVLAEHMAVLDLCAAARAAIVPDDDLSLACALKSPLVGLDDDDLMELAPGRRGSLAAALAADPRYAAAEAAVARWRGRADLGPFDFFARLLGPDGGRRALIGRLGPEAGDAIDEFLARALAHERGDAPSLPGFLDEIAAADAEIKRDMESGGETVRVMTAHASKGLEAPVVFLPDTSGAPTGRHDPSWLMLPPRDAGEAPIPVFAGGSANDSAAMAEGRAEARAAAAGEHRRLLYVAMTRAAQRLVVAGYAGPRGPAEDGWGNLIARGLGPHLEETPASWDPDAKMLRLGRAPEAVAPTPAAAPLPAAAPPGFLLRPAPHEVEYASVSPSRRLAGAVGEARLASLEEGRLAHKLLQNLPDLAPPRRRRVAEDYLARHGGALDLARRAALVEKTISLIETPALSPLFAEGSRAEVPIMAELGRGDGSPAPVSGRVDRIAVGETEVWLADYKSGPPGLREDYVRQLALYRAAVGPLFPGRRVRAFLLWIASGGFQEIAAEDLDAAFDRWSAG